MFFERYNVSREIFIEKLISCHYFEFAKNYYFNGERHDFWEVYYVDKGEIEVTTDSGMYLLKQGDMLVHEPNEFHSTRTNGKIAPNVFLVTFECDAPSLAFFKQNKWFHLGSEERSIMALLLKESFHAFGPNPTHGTVRLIANPNDRPFASEQLFVSYLEILLVSLIRNHAVQQEWRKAPTAVKEKREADLFDNVIEYMKQNLHGTLSLDQLCSHFCVGKSNLSIIFKNRQERGVMEYWNHLKIETAKRYIRENNYNLTEISELLGYNSLHYFSRQFKKTTGMTPSEYAKTLTSRLFNQRS
ncbi:helix-turn-helix domain-containing protein [Paenibacillus allorhizosphaerae]|uniref:HTH-type transcriptional activator RhaR n=1 Tax=Paenibacillus allorhizosphaerae TaxID=2849866 RepID=A0ABM8VB34_9BACL|nr:helix-turn-helix domain-containing protein [Paenibacillus allorhizosphaerae]CAG7618202.1 HTH-type transcriptional activator RhaR [Paenibacillus allorhizosphaerae]